MLYLIKPLIAVALGIALGLAATYEAVDRGVDLAASHAGPWTDFPKAGSLDADPYTRAIRARTGETPLGLAEGLTFLARADNSGAALDPRCDYSVAGATPATRFWTLTALSPDGHPSAAQTGRRGLSSSELVRDANGGFAIVVAPQARPGNWLPIEPGQPFNLMLRLYDTPVSASAGALDASVMPSIARGHCA